MKLQLKQLNEKTENEYLAISREQLQATREANTQLARAVDAFTAMAAARQPVLPFTEWQHRQ